MSSQGTAQILVYAGALLVLAYPLGAWMTRVYGGFRAPGPLGAAERGFYWLVGTDLDEEQDWSRYALLVLVFSTVCTGLLYVILRVQGHLAGYGATNFSAQLGAVAMVLGRYVPLLAALAFAGSVAPKTRAPESAGTLRTDGPTFVVLLVGVIVLTAGMMLLPAVALGPIVEGLGS